MEEGLKASAKRKRKEGYRILTIAVLLGICCFLSYYFHTVLNSCVIFTHLFYVPIILACIWYGRKGVALAVFLAVTLIFSHSFFCAFLLTANDYFRAFMFMAIALVIAALRERGMRSEEALLDSEQKFRQFFENEPEYCYMISPEGIILNANKAALKALGYKKEELLGKPLKIIYAPESVPKIAQFFANWKETGELRNEEMVISSKTGDKRTVLLSASAVKDRGGKILHSVSVQKDITERKRTGEELKEKQEELELITDSIRALIFYKDEKGRFIRVNKALADSTGIPKEEWIGKTVFDLFPKIAKAYTKDDEEVIRAGRPKLGIVEPMESSQGMKTVLTDKMPIKDEKGKVAGLIGLTIDITERKKAEDALKASEARFRMIADYTYSWEMFRDKENDGLAYISPGFERITGYKLDDYISGRIGYKDVFHPDDLEKVEKFFLRSFKKETVSDVEFRIIRKGGALAYVSTSYQPVITRSGEFVGVRISIRDITERKQAEVDIRGLKEYNENIIARIPTAIVTCNKGLRIKTVNDTCCKIFNRTAPDIVGKRLSELLGPKAIKDEELDKKILETLKTKKPSEEIEMKYDFPKIGNKALNLKMVGITQEEEEEVVVILLINDITEKKELQEGIRQADKLASVGQMAAGLAHEINNPITIIKGNAQHMRKKTRLLLSSERIEKDDIKECTAVLERIIEEAELCGKITSGLLQFTRKTEDKVSRLYINKELDTALGVVEHNLSLGKIEVTQKLSPDLPRVPGNGDHLRQVFMNIILNAQAAMPKGGSLKIETLHNKHNRYVEIRFTDTGKGIPEKDINKIFDPFFTTKRPGKGVGLGLSISHGIIKAHHGTIEAKRQIGKGSTFIIKLHT